MSKVQKFYTHAAAFVTDDSGDQDTFVRTSVYRELEAQIARWAEALLKMVNVALIGTSEDDIALAEYYCEARALLAEYDKEEEQQ
jgi:hypothetical protein